MRKLLPALCASLALVAVAGCGGDEEGGSASKQQTTGGGAQAGAVSMQDIAFEPAEVTVKKGATIKWTNKDSVGHDVTKEGGPGPRFTSGKPGGMQSGDTFQQRFDTPGTIEYVCKVHPNMKGTITVR